MASPELTFSTRGEVGAWNESRGRVVERERGTELLWFLRIDKSQSPAFLMAR